MARRQYILDHIREVFQSFGFQALETPAMENLSTLTGKYGDEGDQLLFKILNSGDFLRGVDAEHMTNYKALTPKISEKGLRYDLTVPFARYVVMNRNEVAFPFRRYQIQPVWRADRPQKGRYREFYQCDADVVGTRSLVCEAEIILMIRNVFARLGFTNYTIKVNHRGILNGVAELIDATGKETALFVAIDKLDKMGEVKVREELLERGFTASGVDALFDVLRIEGNSVDKIARLRDQLSGSQAGTAGIADVESVLDFLRAFGTDDAHVELDISLARGLSYYTGCIFEVKIDNVAIGSVSGGGRYDNLTQAFGDKDNLSGVGFSFGVDRIYDAMEELKLFPRDAVVSSRLIICHFDEESLRYGLRVVSSLREAGIAAEIYPDISKIRKQLDFANKKQVPFALVIGSEEITTGLLSLKNLETGEQEKLYLEDVIKRLTKA